MSDALQIIRRPRLQQYQRLAAELRDVVQAGDVHAIGHWAEDWAERVERSRSSRLTKEGRRSIEQQARAFLRVWKRFPKPRKSWTSAQARLLLALGHNFANWAAFTRHLRELTRLKSPVSRFEAAAEAIASGDAATLKRLLKADPKLIRARSTREHRSTLLHYVSANGIEDFRQRTPKNIVAITKILLDAGAEVDAESEAYGGGSTALGLAATSIHPEKAGVQIALLQTLLDHGASMASRSPAGNSTSLLVGCFANGQPAAAEYLARAGAPLDFESAAALGWLDKVKAYFAANGALKSGVTKKKLASALLYASGYGRREVVTFLLDHGASAGMRNHAHETPLHWANYAGHLDVIEMLLARGAPIGVRDKTFSATPLDVALWTWENCPAKSPVRERVYQAIALLVHAGAKFDVRQWADPETGRSRMQAKIEADPRMKAALGL